jgi:hypothetical protein
MGEQQDGGILMTVSASLPIANAKAANTALEEQGFGPANFSVPLRTGTGEATHVGLHCWTKGAFFTALKALPYPVEWTEGNDFTPNFKAHVTAKAFDPKDPENWYANPVMKGDRRTLDGKTWESLIDYNVWPPGVSGWREIVAVGFPAWVQPTGAHDAYGIGAKVSFKAKNYESLISANVWSPEAYPAGWKQIA